MRAMRLSRRSTLGALLVLALSTASPDPLVVSAQVPERTSPATVDVASVAPGGLLAIAASTGVTLRTAAQARAGSDVPTLTASKPRGTVAGDLMVGAIGARRHTATITPRAAGLS
jgi:hypothetical protein